MVCAEQLSVCKVQSSHVQFVMCVQSSDVYLLSYIHTTTVIALLTTNATTRVTTIAIITFLTSDAAPALAHCRQWQHNPCPPLYRNITQDRNNVPVHYNDIVTVTAPGPLLNKTGTVKAIMHGSLFLYNREWLDHAGTRYGKYIW